MSGVPHVKAKHRCRCHRCGKRFVVETECGPSNICDECVIPLMEIIWGRKITGTDKFGNWIFGEEITKGDLLIWHIAFPFIVLFATLGSAILTGWVDSKLGNKSRN